MNKEETLKAIEVMQAFAEGKKIQHKWYGRTTRWQDFDDGDNPSWDWATGEYRIKKSTKPSINWEHVHPDYKWLATDEDGTTYLYKEQPPTGYETWRAKQSARADGFASFTPGDCDWKESLVQRPENV